MPLNFFLFLTSLLPNLELGKPHAYVVCIAFPTSLMVVPTQDFVLFFYYFFSRKQLYFGSEGITRDKLGFWMKKHGHASFQILTRDSYNLDFGTKPLINTLLIVCFFFFFTFA